jgi:hypothetical protein
MWRTSRTSPRPEFRKQQVSHDGQNDQDDHRDYNPLIHSPPDFLSLRFADLLILRASPPHSLQAALRGCIIILLRYLSDEW